MTHGLLPEMISLEVREISANLYMPYFFLKIQKVELHGAGMLQ